MDLTRCTPGQRETVLTVDAPLMVSAGAGSGKTFTLTQRIVHALLPGSDGAPAPLGSIEQVLAITFTKKAAAELRARIKAALRAEGLADQALLADDAWVTTIHGMAARLLRENALEAGIDTAFEVLPEARAQELFDQAVERVVARLDEGAGGPLVAELLADRPLVGKGPYERGAMDDALDLLHRAQAMPAGLDGLQLVEPSTTPAALLRALYELGEEFQQITAAWESPNTREQPSIDAIGPALDGARAWFDDAAQAACGFDDAAFDPTRFRRVLYAFPPTTATFGAKRDEAGFCEGYRAEYVRLAFEAEGALGQRAVQAIAAIARLVDSEFRALKGPGSFDSNDLLLMALRALQGNPAIAERYRRRFRLIMVDEFQDTDKVQVEVIRLLAAPGLANVCVVGDAQQSIYRFRGADINVFHDYRAALRAQAQQAEGGKGSALAAQACDAGCEGSAEGTGSAEAPAAPSHAPSPAPGTPRFPQLTSNFRSHGDVLAVVERVFSQPQSFGEGFLRLEAAGKVNAVPDPAFDGPGAFPRVAVDAVHYQRGTRSAVGVPRDEAVAVAARRIARHFAALRDQHGVSSNAMALLLGKMANAQAYIDALRAEGLDSVMVGGSVFAAAAEPQLVGSLLRYAVNTQDEQALLDALFSPLFAVSDDALLALAYGVDDEGERQHRSFARAFLQEGALEGSGLPDADLQGVALAREALRRFVRSARGGKAASALRALLAGTGLLDYEQGRGADGLAAGGNYAKALRLVESLARETAGIASLSAAYDAALAASKAAPGVLASAQSEFVRIMTVHASKGLQFDHVAVAEVRDGTARPSAFLAENEGSATFALSTSMGEGPARTTRDKVLKLPCDAEPPEWLADARTPGQLLHGLRAFSRQQELDEARRLLYVAMTRAVKSLYLSHVTSSKPEAAYEADGIFAEVHAALGWEAGEGTTVCQCPYGGSAPAQVTCLHLTPETLDDAAPAIVADEPPRATVDVPRRPELPAPLPLPWSPLRQDVRSYSSLEHDYDPAAFVGEVEDEGEAVRAAGGEAAGDASALDDGAADGEAPCAPVSPIDASVPADAPASSDGEVPDAAAESAALAREAPEDATALGTAFHHLAQRAIIACAAEPQPRALRCPDQAAVQAQVRQGVLSAGQQERLHAALDRWFASAVAQRFATCEAIAAEVPFMVVIEGDGSKGPLYLEGEIDGLADAGGGRAFLVDYKTGGSPAEQPEQLHAKHLQQASCYAYALLDQGFNEVEACFVRVEQPDPADPDQPQVVSYRFAQADKEALAASIYAAF